VNVSVAIYTPIPWADETYYGFVPQGHYSMCIRHNIKDTTNYGVNSVITHPKDEPVEPIDDPIDLFCGKENMGKSWTRHRVESQRPIATSQTPHFFLQTVSEIPCILLAIPNHPSYVMLGTYIINQLPQPWQPLLDD